MARNKKDLANIDNSNPSDYPDGRVKNAPTGTPVNEFVYGDIHEFFAKAMRLYGISYNGVPDNETNGYQLIDAIVALASKNDFVLDLTTSGGILQVPLKLGKLKNNEGFILKAGVDKTAETNIVGTLDGTNKPVTFLGNFKENEYVRMVNTATNVVLIRMVDSFNLDLVVSELAYLKKASQAQEDAGAVDTVATTPLSNITAFSKRVNGNDSSDYLAIPTSAGATARNGLMSAADKEKVDNFQSNERNYGTVAGIDSGGGSVGQTYPVSGDITSATLVAKGAGQSLIQVVLNNDMDDLNYEVQINVESNSANYERDNDLGHVVFRKISINTIQVSTDEFNSQPQNVTLHISVKQR